ncbi:hypothetical protein Z946_2542 [Sulfitobacter noctilucicola]|uniref:Threonine dehydrogenase-like Zn-dependent dehydrogenase n=1 Tax=Sulfitobacter noctilucicola TaxID=1342301 RepID=A0A7W6M9B0_9RHOB|nr:hypothetical protein [Sulfitobacter noctilucicola]KIN63669.1 hypothetical protein Z946_2542 [Sulfitobacter noctilucicola]MBB4174821.1 threonine dehydrogenase-like Zn-dependent dehydrogenase [Sulfitobacter noctilucicola]
MTPLRLTVTAVALASLAACGSDYSVRNGPQDVHPSPSRLASGAMAETTAPEITSVQHITVVNVTAPCAAHKSCHHGQYSGHKNDGSRPIVD